LGRNLALTVLAGVVVAFGRNDAGLSAVDWLSRLSTGEIINLGTGVTGLALITVAIVLMRRTLADQANLATRVREIQRSLDEEFDLVPVERIMIPAPLEGLPIGARAPKFSLTAVAGSESSLDQLLGLGKPVFLVFAGADCWGCKMLLPAIRMWQNEYGDRFNFVVVANGSAEQNRLKLEKYGVQRVLADEKSKLSNEYQSQWTPSGVLIGTDGRIASQLRIGDSAIRSFVRDQCSIVEDGNQVPAVSDGRPVPSPSLLYSVLKIGEAFPRFSLAGADGSLFTDLDLVGKERTLLFLHPECEYCKLLVADLLESRSPGSETVRGLVVVAVGVEAKYLASLSHVAERILSDPNSDLAPLVGAQMVPAAIVVDSGGRVASGVAIGEQNVRALLEWESVEVENDARSA